MTAEDLKNLGPLTPLVGTWEGDKGDDIAPDDDRMGKENNKFREQMVFEYIGQVDNHEQTLFGLRYRTMAWRLGAEESFHEEVGYWMWDAKNNQVLRCFIVPRGVTVLAGGTVKEGASEFELSAELGSKTYGICSNQFLDQEFKTIRYDFKIKFLDTGVFSYEEDTQLRIKGLDEVFHHTDSNTMKKC